VAHRNRIVPRVVSGLALAAALAPAWARAGDPETEAEGVPETEAEPEPTTATAAEPEAKASAASLDDTSSDAVRTGEPRSERKAARKAKWRFSLDAPRRVGIETSVLWPAYPGLFFHLKSTVPIHKARGEVLLGAQGRIPQFRAEEGTFSNLDAVLGWRQYAIYGLHFDVMFNLGWGRLRDSTTNGRDYDSFDMELMAVAGWRFGVGPLYFAIQPLGISNVLNRTNPWPIEGRGTPRTEGPIYVGNVLFGLQF